MPTRVEAKRGPGRPKKSRVDIETLPLEASAEVESDDVAMPAVAPPEGPAEVESNQGALVAVESEEAPVAKLTAREYGKLGAEYGRLGGRPRKSLSSVVQLEKGCEQLVEVEKVGASNRKSLSSVSKRADSFGIVAKLEICKMVEARRTLFERSGMSLADVFAAVAMATGREAQKVKYAFLNKQKWLEEERRLQLGQGSKGTLRKQGIKTAFCNRSVSRRG